MVIGTIKKDVIETIGDKPKEIMGTSKKLDCIIDVSAQVVSGCMISKWRLQESIEIKDKLVPTRCPSTKWLIPKLVGAKGELNSNLSEPFLYLNYFYPGDFTTSFCILIVFILDICRRRKRGRYVNLYNEPQGHRTIFSLQFQFFFITHENA